jgi:hypothetical protein
MSILRSAVLGGYACRAGRTRIRNDPSVSTRSRWDTGPHGSSVTRSWKQAMLGGTMFVGFGWLAIYLFLNEHEGWAVIPGLMAVAGIVAAIRGRQGTCPGCGTRVHFEHRHGASACSMCGRYSRLEEGRVKFVEPGFIAMSPSFKVPFDAFLDRPDTLRHRWPWHWPRPGRCCVCGALATRSKGYVIT